MRFRPLSRAAITAFLRRRWLDGFLILLLLLGLASVVNVAGDVGKPFGGFFVWRNVSLNVWQLETSTPPGWPVLATGLLHYDDDLLKLDGQPYDANAGRLYAAALGRGQTTIRLTLDRNGIPLDINLPLQRLQLGQFFDIKLPDLINGLGFWMLAVAVFRARRNERVNQIFALGCGLIAGALWLTIDAVFPEADVRSRAMHLAWIVSVSFVGAAFIHLITLYPEPMDRAAQRWAPGLYAVAAGLAGLSALSILLWWFGWQALWVIQLYAFGLQAAMAIFGAMVLLVMLRLLWLLVVWFFRQRRASRRPRRQLIFMLTGLAISLPFIGLMVSRITFAAPLSYFWQGLDLRYLVLAFPLTHAFIILRYQTYRGGHPLLVGMLILVSSALLASVGAWLTPLIMPQWQGMVGGTLFPALFIMALGASLFWSTRRAWQGAFNRLFQWEQRSYAAVRQVGQQVVREIDLARLPEIIAQALVDNLRVERAAIWLRSDKDRAFRLAGQAGQWAQPPPAAVDYEPGAGSGPLRLTGEDLPAALTPLRASHALEVLAPLWAAGDVIGLLGLDKRDDEDFIDERDMEIIELISQQSALFLFTALQVERLREVPQVMARQVAEAQEREQFKIAQELHDTTQQFLGRLPFFLELSRSAVRADPEQAEALLARCLVDVETEAQTLRHIRNILAPVQLEQSLERPLRALVEQASGRQTPPVAVHLAIEPEVESALAQQPDARRTLYRVVQQALDNSLAHAQAKHITIVLTRRPEGVEFGIADDGCGSSDEERARAAERGSFGLKSMPARVTSLGGEFSFESAPGEGTRIRGWLPVSGAAKP